MINTNSAEFIISHYLTLMSMAETVEEIEALAKEGMAALDAADSDAVQVSDTTMLNKEQITGPNN